MSYGAAPVMNEQERDGDGDAPSPQPPNEEMASSEPSASPSSLPEGGPQSSLVPSQVARKRRRPSDGNGRPRKRRRKKKSQLSWGQIKLHVVTVMGILSCFTPLLFYISTFVIADRAPSHRYQDFFGWFGVALLPLGILLALPGLPRARSVFSIIGLILNVLVILIAITLLFLLAMALSHGPRTMY